MNDYGYLADSFIKELSDFVQACEVWFWISVIINVIVLICFFILCSNIAKIKKNIHSMEHFEARFNFLYGVGELVEARKLLLQKIQLLENADEAFFCKQDYKKNSREYIERKYKPYFDKLEMHIDYNKIDALIEEQMSEK